MLAAGLAVTRRVSNVSPLVEGRTSSDELMAQATHNNPLLSLSKLPGRRQGYAQNMTGLTPGHEKTAMAYAKARAIAKAGSPPSDSALADAMASACEAAPPSAAKQISQPLLLLKQGVVVHGLACPSILTGSLAVVSLDGSDRYTPKMPLQCS